LAEADLLALDFARIARHVTGVPKHLAQGLIVIDESAGQTMTDRAGLARGAAAFDRSFDVEVLVQIHGLERLAHDHAGSLAAEELLERAPVDSDGAGALTQEHAGGGCLAAAGAVIRRNGHGGSVYPV